MQGRMGKSVSEMKYGQGIYENPSPGNREGGISTLEEKSLGCI